MNNKITLLTIFLLMLGTLISNSLMSQNDIFDIESTSTCYDQGQIEISIDPQSIMFEIGSFTYPLHLRWYNTEELINETMLINSEDELDIVLQNLPPGEWDIILTVDVFCTFETTVEIGSYDLHGELAHKLLNGDILPLDTAKFC